MLKPKPNEIRKPTRTISGITPIAIMLPPRKCEHGSCIYCPNLDVPQSYTPKSPVVMRAARVNYDAFKQVKARIEAFKAMNHKTEKIELIIMGGTFMEYSKKFQYEFIKRCYDALNPKKSKDLESAKRLNERSLHRCVALCVETRPDVIDIKKMRDWGVTRVELGVQIIDDKIYKLVKRGHTVKDVTRATKKLKDAGFKIGYHIMPGLPGSDLKLDIELFKKLFSDERFKPDQLKIYPCQVMPGSELEKLYWKGKYKPYTKEELEKILLKMLKAVPRYCRVMRVMREIPPEYLVAGTLRIDLRKVIEEELRKKNTKLKEIRYREVGFARQAGLINPPPSPSRHTRMAEARKNQTSLLRGLKLKTTKYKASSGDEYFLEVVNSPENQRFSVPQTSGKRASARNTNKEVRGEDILFGLLRLRITSLRSGLNATSRLDARLFAKKGINSKNLEPGNESVSNDDKLNVLLTKFKAKKSGEADLVASEPERRAIIRELHVYGPTLNLGEKGHCSVYPKKGRELLRSPKLQNKGAISQHKGIGKWLMEEAEKIVKKNKINEVRVISGVGVREYYRKLGYKLDNEGLMVKKL